MENLFIEVVKLINPLQLVVFGLIVYYFYNRLDDKIKNVRTDIKDTENRLTSRIDKLESDTNNLIDKQDDKFDKIEDRFDKLEDKIDAVNARIDRLNDLMLDLYKTLFKKDVA